MTVYEKIKNESEKYWETKVLKPNVYGFQIQTGSKWNEGLTNNEITAFESDVGFTFSQQIKDFYTAMNGLNMDGINIYAGSVPESNYKYYPAFFSYPKDIEIIKENIKHLEETNGLSYEDLPDHQKLLPLQANKYILNNTTGVILSMHPNDNIVFSNSIIEYLQESLFNKRSSPADLPLDEDMRVWIK